MPPRSKDDESVWPPSYINQLRDATLEMRLANPLGRLET